jgi:hypothetical protein
MSKPGPSSKDPRDAIDELTRLQQRAVRRYGRYATRSIERVQRGEIALDKWLDDYQQLLRDAADDARDAITALTKLGGARRG